MFKLCIFLALVACAASAPAPAPAPGAILASSYAALPVALPAATSSQSIVRNYNTLAAAPLAYSAYSPIAYNAYAYPASAYIL